jgi:hypothetical protein
LTRRGDRSKFEFASGCRIKLNLAIAGACPLALEGLHSPLKGPVGVDAFQALMLAQQLARTLLDAFIERGGMLLDGPGGRAVSVQGLFDSGLMS